MAPLNRLADRLLRIFVPAAEAEASACQYICDGWSRYCCTPRGCYQVDCNYCCL